MKRLTRTISLLVIFTVCDGALASYGCAEFLKLLASDSQEKDNFGCAVSVDGNYCIVGAYGDADNGYKSGSAYIFIRDGNSWLQHAKLLAWDGQAEHRFGFSVSMSDSYCIVGAYGNEDYSGSAYIFARDGDSWLGQTKLFAWDGEAKDYFGRSVSISDSHCIVGAYGNGNYSGSAYIFARNGNSWTRQAKLRASDGCHHDRFGYSVSISGDYAIVGADSDDGHGPTSGSSYIFKREGDSWIQQAKLVPSDVRGGDYFGQSVSISGDYCVVGAPGHGEGSGAAYIFARDGGNWIQRGKLVSASGREGDCFGESVSMRGEYCIVGASGHDASGSSAGSAYIFTREDDSWIQKVKLLSSDGHQEDILGVAVSTSESVCVVGACGDDDNGYSSGSAYIFKLEPGPVVDLEISGLQEVGANCSAYYAAIAYDDDGCAKDVAESALWWVTPENVANIEAGLLSVQDVNATHDITIYAEYAEGEIIIGAEMEVQVCFSPPLQVPSEYATIQEAVNAAMCGDEIIVADGVYTGEGNRDIDFLGKAITVKSESGAESCIIDCNAGWHTKRRAFYIYGNKYAAATLEGFTITGGRAYDGGAIHCEESSPIIENCIIADTWGPDGVVYCREGSPTIRNCIITGNFVGGWAATGCIYCESTNATILDCDIMQNHGTGLACRDSNVVVSDCTIVENDGAGIMHYQWQGTNSLSVIDCVIAENKAWGIALGASSATVSGCLITKNTANWGGGGICCLQAELASDLAVDKSFITENTAPHGGGIYLEVEQNTLVITNSVISGNTAEGQYASGGGIACICRPRAGKRLMFAMSNCNISGNTAKRGGGIYCDGADMAIIDCNISGNSAYSGGGIGCPGQAHYSRYGDTIVVKNCKIVDNTADIGAGIRLGRVETGSIENSIITGNRAFGELGYGGAAACWDASYFINCTMTGNSAQYGGAIYCEWGGPSVNSSILWSNEAPHGMQIYCAEDAVPILRYTDIQGGWEGEGNIDVDPCFVMAGFWNANGVWVEGDYRLLAGSLCIDTGDPNYAAEPNETDLDGNPRVIDGDEDGVAVVDMGTYEFWPPVEGQMKLTPRTLNCASKGKYIKAHIILPEEILPEDIDVNTPAVAEPADIDSEYIRILGGDTGPVKLQIAFSRAAFCEALTETAEIEITVTGFLNTGQAFYATDTITVKEPPAIRKSIKQAQTRRLRRNNKSIIKF